MMLISCLCSETVRDGRNTIFYHFKISLKYHFFIQENVAIGVFSSSNATQCADFL